MIYQLIIAQVLAIAYTVFSVKQEKPINSMMTDYVPPSRLLSKEYHQFGFYMTITFCAVISLFSRPLGILALLWYGLLFDLLISKKLGSESWWDRMFKNILKTFYIIVSKVLGKKWLEKQLKKDLGKNALIIKSILIALLIIALNYLSWKMNW